MMFGEELQSIDSLEVSVDLQMAYCFQIFRASHHPSFWVNLPNAKLCKLGFPS
jgi:hypothetical protein